MKKTILLKSLFIVFIFVSSLCALDSEQASVDPEQFIKELTMEAFKQEYGRDPKDEGELKDFELEMQKMGEQIIKTEVEERIKKAEKEGEQKSEEDAMLEFFSDFWKSIEEIADEEPEEETIEVDTESGKQEAPVPPAPAKKEQKSPEEIQSIQELLTQLLNAIHTFRLKASSNKQMRDSLIPYKYRLDDLIYLLNVINDKMLVEKYLSDPTFIPLVNNLKRLHRQFIELEDAFTTKEPDIEPETAYETLNVMVSATPEEIIEAYQDKMRELNPTIIRKTLSQQGLGEAEIKQALDGSYEKKQAINHAYGQIRQQEEAKYLFESILSLLDQATDVQNIPGTIQKVLEKYKQDALKAFQEREKIEKEARQSHEQSLRSRQLLFPLTEKRFDWPQPSRPDRDRSGFKPSYGFDKEPSKDRNGESAKPTDKKPLKPTPGKKDGKKKKEEDKKKKDEPAKKEDKDKKAGDKKPEGEKLDIAVSEQVVLAKDEFRQFEKPIIDNMPDKPNEANWKTFAIYLTTPINPNNEEDIKQAKKFQGAITEMTTALNKINKRMQDAFKDDATKKKSFKAEVKKIVDKFNKKLDGVVDEKEKEKLKEKKIDPKNFQKIKPLLTDPNKLAKDKQIPVPGELRDTSKPIDPSKKYVFFGEGDPEKSPFDPKIKALNKPSEEDKKLTNFIELLQASYKKLQDQFSK